MRILLLGSLGPYPERFSCFMDEGHQLWYVCTEWQQQGDPRFDGMTTCNFYELGPTPEACLEKVLQLIKVERIGAVYSLLNVWDGSNPVTAALLKHGCPVPVIRHYKEHYFSPSEEERCCLEKSNGVIFINEESRNYFDLLYNLPKHTACLDADLIPRRYLSAGFQPKLSSQDNTPHLLLAGTVCMDNGRYDYRDIIHELTNAGAHVHLYARFRELTHTGQLTDTNQVKEAYRKIGVKGLVHFCEPIPPRQFVQEWSGYDAGLLHVPRTDDPFRTLNLPNRYSAYLAAGVPVALQQDAMPAMQRQLEALGAGILYTSPAELVNKLPDAGAVARAKAVRETVTFEAVYPQLINFIKMCGASGCRFS